MSDLKAVWLAAEHDKDIAADIAERALEAWEQARAVWKEKNAEARRCWQLYKESEKGETL